MKNDLNVFKVLSCIVTFWHLIPLCLYMIQCMYLHKTWDMKWYDHKDHCLKICNWNSQWQVTNWLTPIIINTDIHNEGCPSLDGQTSMCTRGCMYIFTSNADKLRHELLVHYFDRKAEHSRKRQPRDLVTTWMMMCCTSADTMTVAAALPHRQVYDATSTTNNISILKNDK